jgi:GNAT superfamily N-acetyltransferase
LNHAKCKFYPEYAEFKRMWVDPEHRGIGVGSRILERLEEEARRGGRRKVRLDTNRSLREAQALYLRAGYHRIARYNDNPYAQQWYEKELD